MPAFAEPYERAGSKANPCVLNLVDTKVLNLLVGEAAPEE
jgi:hypothetical protein